MRNKDGVWNSRPRQNANKTRTHLRGSWRFTFQRRGHVSVTSTHLSIAPPVFTVALRGGDHAEHTAAAHLRHQYQSKRGLNERQSTGQTCYAMWKRGGGTGAVKGWEMHKTLGGRNESFLFLGAKWKGCEVISSSAGPRRLVPLLRMAPCLRWKDG